jgi:maltokinase
MSTDVMSLQRVLRFALRELEPGQLVEFISTQRWFGGKGQSVVFAEIDSAAPLPCEGCGCESAALTRVRVVLGDDRELYYQLPLALRVEATDTPALMVARTGSCVLHDAVESPDFRRQLGRAFAQGSTLPGPGVRWEFEPLADLDDLHELPTRVMGGEQSNTSIAYGDKAILKLFRRLEPGINPDVEIARFLTTRTDFKGTPALLGVLHLRDTSGSNDGVAGMLQAFMPGSVDGWAHVLARLREQPDGGDALHAPLAEELVALGRITRELHAALASDAEDPDFAPEPTTDADLARWRDAIEAASLAAMANLAAQTDHLRPDIAANARTLLGREEAVRALLRRPLAAATAGPKIRHHGDYHLGQVLFTGAGDWRIIDFEGEPARPLVERRAKHHPLRDVAGMLRSFAYAAAVAGTGNERAMRTAFLAGYDPGLHDDLERAGLLALFETEKLFYELGYELGSRPEWAWIPLAGITRLLS